MTVHNRIVFTVTHQLLTIVNHILILLGNYFKKCKFLFFNCFYLQQVRFF